MNLYAFVSNNAVNGYDVLGNYQFCVRETIQEWGEGGGGNLTGGGSMGMPSGVPVVDVGGDFDLTAGAGMSINSALNAAAMVRNGASQSDAERVAKAYANGGAEAAENTAQQIDSTNAEAARTAATAAGAAGGNLETKGQASQFGNGQLLKPGMEPALDAMITNDNIVNQLGVLYGLNQEYGNQSSSFNVTLTEFFATLNGSSANSRTLYSGEPLNLSVDQFNGGGWTASVQPSFTFVDLLAVAHTHPIDAVPSDNHDFAFQSPILSSRGAWSVIVAPSKIYFTGPKPGQYYYLPTSAFTNAGKANGKTVTVPSRPPRGP